MSKLTGVFEQFKNPDQIPLQDITRWVKHAKDPKAIENFIGNRILYPQTVALNESDLGIDYAIMRESIRRNQRLYLNPIGNKISLEQSFIARFPPAAKFINIIVQSLDLPELTTILVKNNVGMIVSGSVINIRKLPNFDKLKEQEMLELFIDGTPTKIRLGGISILSLKDHHIKLKIDGLNGMMVAGGTFGLVLDFRLEPVSL
ncbi:hypothetical protein HYW46_00170 [Candidatus Daviesbacteria bacterium]|nr:hypothetical protein [Candidatus Daviesbacteria bacterium]